VLRIHDILVWIRIRIRGSMPLTNGSGSGFRSFYFHHSPSRCQQKTNLKKKFFCTLLFIGTFTSFFKDKSQKESQIVRIKVFLLFLHDDRRIRIHTSDLWIRIRIQEDQKHMDWIRIRIRNTSSNRYQKLVPQWDTCCWCRAALGRPDADCHPSG
jgi:hypothetical protein